MTDLEKEIEELKDKVHMWDFFAEGCGFKKRNLKTAIQISEYIDKLEAQIKKMRCCGNCKHRYNKHLVNSCNMLKCYCLEKGSCTHWEIED